MAENKMKQVAKLLGVEIGEKFEIKGVLSNPYHFSKIGLVDKLGRYCNAHLTNLLNGEIEIQKPILTQREKEYLEGVLKPFKSSDIFVVKRNNYYFKNGDGYLYIELNPKDFENRDKIELPFFKKDSMYRGMQLNKIYTSSELGLFEED